MIEAGIQTASASAARVQREGDCDMAYKSTTLKTAITEEAKANAKAADKLTASIDAAILKCKAAKAEKEKVIRDDQIRDGVKAVCEFVAQWGVNHATPAEIGKMIGYQEAFVAGVLKDLENE